MAEISRYCVQWAGQFFAAAELSRRGYQVALTLGNAEGVDLMAVTPSGRMIKVEVKAMSTRNFWRYRRIEPEDDLMYVFVYLGDDRPHYYILTSMEAAKEREEYFNSQRPEKRVEPDAPNWGARFSQIERYEDAWGTIPR